MSHLFTITYIFSLAVLMLYTLYTIFLYMYTFETVRTDPCTIFLSFITLLVLLGTLYQSIVTYIVPIKVKKN